MVEKFTTFPSKLIRLTTRSIRKKLHFVLALSQTYSWHERSILSFLREKQIGSTHLDCAGLSFSWQTCHEFPQFWDCMFLRCSGMKPNIGASWLTKAAHCSCSGRNVSVFVPTWCDIEKSGLSFFRYALYLSPSKTTMRQSCVSVLLF